MSLQLYTSQLQGYLEAEYNVNQFLNGEISIINYDGNPNFPEGNVFKSRQLIPDSSGWDTVTANTNAVVSSVNSAQMQEVAVRRSKFWKMGGMEALAYGADGILEKYAGIMMDHFVKNLEGSFFTNILPAAFNSGGPLSASHISTSAGSFNFGLVGTQRMANGNPNIYKHLFMHPDVLGNANLTYDTPSLTITNPIVPFSAINFIGQKNGLYIWSSDSCQKVGSGATASYDSYLFGDDSLYVDFQKTPLVNISQNALFENGSTIASYSTAFALGIKGITWVGSTPSDAINGATDAELATVSNWGKLTSIRNNQIHVAAIRSYK